MAQGDGRKMLLVVVGTLVGCAIILLVVSSNHSDAIASGSLSKVNRLVFWEGAAGGRLLAFEEVQYWSAAGGKIPLPQEATARRLDVLDLASGKSVARRELIGPVVVGSLVASSPRYLWFKGDGDDEDYYEAWDPLTGLPVANHHGLGGMNPALAGGWNRTVLDRAGNLYVITNSADEYEIDGTTFAISPSTLNLNDVDDDSAPKNPKGPRFLDGRDDVRASDGLEYAFSDGPRRALTRGGASLGPADLIAPAFLPDTFHTYPQDDIPLELEDPPSLLVGHFASLDTGAPETITRVALTGGRLWSYPPDPSVQVGTIQAFATYQDEVIAVFAASATAYTVVALDARTGAVRWSTPL